MQSPIVVLYKFFLISLTLAAIPVCIVIAVLLVLFDGLPILYKQERVGFRGKTFVLYKFRTMQVYADKIQQHFSQYNEANGPVFKIYQDPRFTTFGKFLSHTGLDEIPQIYNVLLGDMSLIGPRPLPTEEVKHLKKWHLKRHSVKPGIISPWIFNGYHTRTFNEWMTSDITYAKNKNFRTDTLLIVKALFLFLKLITKELFPIR